jgi:hypothetical protein
MSSEKEALFKRLLKALRPLLREFGFRASGQSFILESAECWVIINFQKSRWAGSDEVTFYVNVAACAKRWLGFEGKPADKAPRYYACDWRWRVEEFGPDKNIQQWTLCDEGSLQRTVTYLRALLGEFVLPATRTMTTESELIKQTGGFEYPQLKTRSVILAATNQLSELKQTVAALIEKYGSGAVAQDTGDHLKLLRSTYPEVMRGIEPLEGESS